MKEHAERKTLLSRPQKILISGFKLEQGPTITLLLLFCPEKGVILRDVFWLQQYTTHRCFESFVENVVDARQEGDRNKESTVVAETMKLIRSSSYAYQILYRSRHTSTKYVEGPHLDNLLTTDFSGP